jgi:hypothetical protein
LRDFPDVLVYIDDILLGSALPAKPSKDDIADIPGLANPYVSQGHIKRPPQREEVGDIIVDDSWNDSDYADWQSSDTEDYISTEESDVEFDTGRSGIPDVSVQLDAPILHVVRRISSRIAEKHQGIQNTTPSADVPLSFSNPIRRGDNVKGCGDAVQQRAIRGAIESAAPYAVTQLEMRWRQEFPDVLERPVHARDIDPRIRGPFGVARIELKIGAKPMHKKFFRCSGECE